MPFADQVGASTSEVLARFLSTQLVDLVCLHEADGTCVWVSPSAERILGYVPEGLVGRHFYEALHPDDVDLFRELHEAALGSEGEAVVGPVTWRMRHRDGHHVWLEVQAQPVRDDEGRVQQLYTVSRDVTERVEAERRAREKERRFQAIFHAMFQFIGLLRPDGTLLEANDTALQVAGLAPEDVIGKKFWDCYWWQVDEATRQRLREAVREAAAGHFVRYTVDVQAAGGHLITVDFSLKPVFDEEGRVILLIAEGRDLTEQVRAREALREREAFLDSLFRGVDLALFVVDVTEEDDFILEETNPRHEELSGLTSGETRGRPLSDLVGPLSEEDVAASRARYRRCVEERRPLQYEERFAVEGEPAWWLTRLTPIFDREGRVYRLVGASQSITELKEAQAALTEAKEQAEEASQAKGDFLARVSHEIRTPLNGVMGMADVLLGTALSTEQREYATAVRDSGKALLHLLDDVLDLSKVEAGRIELEHISFDVHRAVEDAAALFAPQAAEKGLRLVCYVDPDVPRGLRGDPYRLRQILTNLLSNAVKFTDEGYVLLHLRRRNEGDGSMVLRFTVEDTGIGIPAQAQEHLFKAFRQADETTTRRYGGTGLGLAIAQQLADLMGGTLRVDSAPGEGAAFHLDVTLPEALDVAAPGRSEAWKVLDGARLLLAEPCARLRGLRRALLEAHGLVVQAVGSAEAAREHLRTAPSACDVVLAAHEPPMLDALALARDAEVPVVVLGGQARDEERHTVLPEPVRTTLLLDALAGEVHRAAPPVQVEKPSAPASGLDSLHVLLVEDDLINQRVTTAMLRRLGCTSEVVGDGAAVVEAVQQQPFDIVLMDCHMPVQDGYSATRAIRALAPPHRDVPIVALTADAMAGTEERCREAGMDAYLTKPFSLGELREALAAAFKKAR